MRNLYHGEKLKTVYKETEYHNKTSKKHTPIMHKKYYYSKILEKDIKVFVTMKALETID